MVSTLVSLPPTATTDSRLLRAYARTRDASLRAELVERYLPLVRSIARRYARGSEPLEDLVQVASIGLLKAVDRYDPERGVAFSSYATPTIVGEVQRHFRDRCWAVRPPRDLQDRALAVARVAEDLARRLGHAPSVRQIGQALELDDEAVLEARTARLAGTAVSLSVHSDDDEEGDLESVLGDLDDGYAAAEARALYARLQRCLTQRERRLLALRFHDDLTQQEIGELIGVSQMQVSRLIRGALAKLHEAAIRA